MVERNETHHASQHDNAAQAMGFTTFNPSYALQTKRGSYPLKFWINFFVFLSQTASHFFKCPLEFKVRPKYPIESLS